MIEYMNYALNIFSGKGYTDIDGSLIIFRGPIFPLMIAASFWLFDVSPWSAFWTVRIFCILNPVIVYFLGKKLIGKWTGLIAALLILTSYSINYWSYRHIDPVWSFFAIGTVLSIYIAFEQRKLAYFILSGVLIGISYLIKQVAIFLMPLPVLLFVFVREYREKEILLGIIAYFIFVLLMATPWILYVYLKTEDIYIAISGVGSNDLTLSLNISDKLKNYFIGLASYYSDGNNTLSNNFMIGPLFIIAWLNIIYLSFRKKRSAIILCICFLLLSPYLSICGQEDLRLGQLILFILLSYLCVAITIMNFSIAIANKINILGNTKNQNVAVGISVIITLCLVLLQVFGSKDKDKGASTFFHRSAMWNYFTGESKEKKVDGTFNSSLNKVVNWAENNIKKDEGIFFSWQTDARTVYVLTKGVCRVRQIPFIWFNIKNFRLNPIKGMMKNESVYFSDSKLKDVLFISSQQGAPSRRNRHLWVLYESRFIDSIKKNNINYIVVGSIFNSLFKYLENSPYFSWQISFDDNRYRIYKVVSKPELTTHKIYITTRTLNWLRMLKKDDQALFDRYKEIGFKNQIGIPPQVLESLVTNSLPSNFLVVDFIK